MEKILGNTIVTAAQASELLHKYGSPLFVYDAEIVKQKAMTLANAAKGYHISYAIKANNNSQILNILK